MLTVKIKGTEYPLATTLRVAYKVQGQHNHKPYTEVFKALGDMVLEDQIGIVYAAFECANTDQAFKIKRQDFLEAYLDEYNIKLMMEQIKEIIRGIMGEDFFDENEAAQGDTSPQEDTAEGDTEAKN